MKHKETNNGHNAIKEFYKILILVCIIEIRIKITTPPRADPNNSTWVLYVKEILGERANVKDKHTNSQNS